MVVSIFIARLLGPVFVLVGLALLTQATTYRAILQDFLRSPALHYLAGFLGLIAGLTLVLTHNVWAADWRLLITLIGWLALVRAVVTMFRPQWMVTLGNAVLEHRNVFPIAAAVDLLLGLVLSYFGYFG